MMDEATEEQVLQLESEKSAIRKLLDGYKEKIIYANEIGESTKALELKQEMNAHKDQLKEIKDKIKSLKK